MKPKFLAALSILGNQAGLYDEAFSILEEYTMNKSFRKLVGLKSEAVLNLTKHLQRLND